MAHPFSRRFASPAEIEGFTMLVLRYLDNECSAEEVKQLKEMLAGHAAHRELFVQICRMQGDLHEACASRRAELKHKTIKINELVPAARVAEPSAAEAAASGGHGLEISLEPGFPPSSNPESAADTVVPEFSGDDTLPPPLTPPDQ